jgi:hypothetical protein
MELVAYTRGMARENILIILGILTILAPFAGLPISWLEFILPAIGLAVAALGYSFRAPRSERDSAVSASGIGPSVL